MMHPLAFWENKVAQSDRAGFVTDQAILGTRAACQAARPFSVGGDA